MLTDSLVCSGCDLYIAAPDLPNAAVYVVKRGASIRHGKSCPLPGALRISLRDFRRAPFSFLSRLIGTCRNPAAVSNILRDLARILEKHLIMNSRPFDCTGCSGPISKDDHGAVHYGDGGPAVITHNGGSCRPPSARQHAPILNLRKAPFSLIGNILRANRGDWSSVAALVETLAAREQEQVNV